MLRRFRFLPYYIYSFFWCMRFLNVRQAMHIPVLVHPCVRVDELHKGSLSLRNPIRHGMISIGFKGTVGRSNCQTIISIAKGGKLIIGDNVQMAKGTRIVISERGIMSIGNQFWCNGDCYFYCTSSISIGNDNMYGWNISFSTSDGHNVYDNGQIKVKEGSITIGNHVWIASNCVIAKGTYIAEDSVVAQNSLLNKCFRKPKCLIGGVPAKIIKDNFTWLA